jgi:hypothetical protein
MPATSDLPFPESTTTSDPTWNLRMARAASSSVAARVVATTLRV